MKDRTVRKSRPAGAANPATEPGAPGSEAEPGAAGSEAEPGAPGSQAEPGAAGSEAYWSARLPRERYSVLREKVTEPPFTGELLDEHAPGTYSCAGCGSPLFSSTRKFDSGSGWPSFTDPLPEDPISYTTDTSHGMVRTEICCSRCGGHLGHVFDDGPGPSGKRYCVNSLALAFAPENGASVRS